MSMRIRPEDLDFLIESDSVRLLDVRRKADDDADPETTFGAAWRTPEQIDAWSRALPKDRRVVVYCVKGKAGQPVRDDGTDKERVSGSLIDGGLKAFRESSGQRGET